MFSRAHLLIEREFDRIKKEGKSHGIAAYQVSDDSIFEWIVKLKGLKGTKWEDGIFRLYLKFDEYYNTRPPGLCFHTIPFHPNVDPITGKPCLDYLDNPSAWNPSISILNMLLSIQMLLSNPVTAKAVNAQAGDLCVNRPAVYNQTVADCVAASQRLDMGLDPFVISKPIPVIQTHIPSPVGPPPTAPRQNVISDIISKVSFDEYHDTWRGMATSLPSQQHRNEYADEVMRQPGLSDVHSGMGAEERRHREKLQMMEHKTVYHGRVKGSDNSEWKDARMAELEKMKKMYLPSANRGRSPLLAQHTFSDVPVNTPRGPSTTDQHWENEVDELVAWTANLDDSHL